MTSDEPNRIQRWISAAARAYVSKLPNWRGKLRALRLLGKGLVVEVKPNVWVRVDPRVAIEASLLEQPIRFDNLEIEFLWKILEPGMTVVDVGAFVGVMALVAARRVGPSGRVIAFEPAPQSLIRLAENRELNGINNITVVASAVGDRYGTIPYYFRRSCPDQSSVGYQRDADASSIIVPVTPLDDVVAQLDAPRIDILKIDVEGAEPSVIAGAAETLSSPTAPLLVVEINPGALRWCGNSAPQLVDAILSFGYDLKVLEVAKSGAYVNAIGMKPVHRERFPGLNEWADTQITVHPWYQPHRLRNEL